MKSISLLIFLFLGSLSAFAQTSPDSKLTDESFFLASGALDIRAEETVDGYNEGNSYYNAGFGYGVKNLLFLFEVSYSQKETGNATLSVNQKYWDYVAWGYYTAPQTWNNVEAFFGAGVGAYQVEVQSDIYDASANNKTNLKMTGGISLGIRPVWDPFWLSLEVRARAGEDFQPNPTATFLGRIGFKF